MAADPLALMLAHPYHRALKQHFSFEVADGQARSAAREGDFLAEQMAALNRVISGMDRLDAMLTASAERRVEWEREWRSFSLERAWAEAGL